MYGYIKKYCRKLKREYKKKENEKKNDNKNNIDQVATTTIGDLFIVYDDNDVVNIASYKTS